jgi:hypothetical protein
VTLQIVPTFLEADMVKCWSALRKPIALVPYSNNRAPIGLTPHNDTRAPGLMMPFPIL